MKSIGAKETLELIYKTVGKPTFQVASETDGKNMYVVKIEAIHRGVPHDPNFYLIIFKDNVKEANGYISWFTDGEIENTYISKQGMEELGEERYRKLIADTKSYGKIVCEDKGFGKEDFLRVFGSKIKYHIENRP